MVLCSVIGFVFSYWFSGVKLECLWFGLHSSKNKVEYTPSGHMRRRAIGCRTLLQMCTSLSQICRGPLRICRVLLRIHRHRALVRICMTLLRICRSFFADILGSFADILGSFADMKVSLLKIWGFFTDI